MTMRAFVSLHPVSLLLARAMRPQRFLPAGLVIAALAFPLLAPTQAASAQETQEEKGIDLIWGLKIPMRDVSTSRHVMGATGDCPGTLIPQAGRLQYQGRYLGLGKQIPIKEAVGV